MGSGGIKESPAEGKRKRPWSRSRFVVVCLAMSAALFAAPSVTGASAPDRSAWMPDVEQRVAELRQRMQASAAEARQRRARAEETGDQWRRMAARPRPAAALRVEEPVR